MISLVKILTGPIERILDKVIPDKDAREKMAHEIATMAERQTFEIAKAQMEVNKQEAQHKSLFVAGWRPAVGWVCVAILAFNFIVIPCVEYAVIFQDVKIGIPPRFSMSELMLLELSFMLIRSSVRALPLLSLQHR